MKFSNKNHDLTRQNEKNVTKSQKHDANLQKNTTLYFQIGLILCLFAVYSTLEMRFEVKETAIVYDETQEDKSDYIMVADNYKIEEVEDAQKQKKVEKKVIIDPEIIDDEDTTKKETEKVVETLSKEVSKDAKVKLVDPDDIIVDEIPEEVSVMFVEMVPVYPGCESATNNDQRRKCMSEKLSKLVQKKFDTDIASEIGLSGKQRIFVNFRINKEGKVEIVSTRAPHPKLEKEAMRVVNKAKQMKPGYQGGKPVNVLYSLPIMFNVQN